MGCLRRKTRESHRARRLQSRRACPPFGSDHCHPLPPSSRQAKTEYGTLLDTFIKYSAEQPGTHVSEVGKTMATILRAGRPHNSYKVGPDSKAAPIVGSLPVTVSEWIVKKSMYNQLGSV